MSQQLRPKSARSNSASLVESHTLSPRKSTRRSGWLKQLSFKQPFLTFLRDYKVFALPATGMLVTAFTDLSPVNPGAHAFLLWTPGETAIWALLLMAAILWNSQKVARVARADLAQARKIEETRRAISAIGVAANWDLDLERLYSRVSQDLKSIIEFDRMTITSAQKDGRMRVEFVSGDPDEGLAKGSYLPSSIENADGLSSSALSEYRSRLTVPIAACDGTLTIRHRRQNAYGAYELDMLRQTVAQISPGISNAINYRKSQLQVKERTALASIGRAANSQQELHEIFETVERALADLIPFDHVGVVLSQQDSDESVVAYWSKDGLLNRWQGDSVMLDLDKSELSTSQGRDPLGLGTGLDSGPVEVRTWLQAPLVVHESLIGLLVLSAPGATGFSNEQSSLLQNVSLQIAPAIQNAMLNADLTRRADERRAIAAIGLAANNELELETIFQRVAEELSHVIEYDRLSVIYEGVEPGEREVAYACGIQIEGRMPGDRITDPPLNGSTADSGASSGARVLDVPPTLKEAGINTIIQVPLGSDQSYIGSLNIHSRTESAFDDHIIEFLERVGHQVAPAIRNARMLAAERELRSTLDRQNQELQEATNARKQFLSSVSHELKTPLTIIAGFIDLLHSDEGDMSKEEKDETLDIIRRNANHLDVLINDILDISRLDAGTFKILPGAFNVSILVRDIESSFHSMLDDRRQKLEVNMPEDEIWVNADRTRISQVVTNMVSNASKYSPEDTSIELTCEVDKDRLHIAVRDHGIGIPDEEKESLFTPFFRVDNETTRKVSGTGLGLVIAKSIVEIHGGEINLVSEQGQGTTIEFWLPDLTTEEEALGDEDEQPVFTGSRLWQDDELDEFEASAS